MTEGKKKNNLEWLFDILNNSSNARMFPLQFDGNLYGATDKKLARGMIVFPNDLGNTRDLRFLDDWVFLVIAIPKEDVK